MPRVPSYPRIYQRTGGPVYWAYTAQGPRRTFAGDTGDVSDLAGNTPALTRGAGCNYLSGPNGSCISCDGTATGVAIGSDARLPMGSAPRTVGCWMKGPPVDPNTNVFFLSYGGGGAYHSGFFLGAYQDAMVFTQVGDSFKSTISITDNAWHRVWVTHDGTTQQMFIDGEFNASAVTAVDTIPSVLVVGGAPARPQYNQICLVDDIQIYDRVLSPAEIARDYADPCWRLRRPSRTRRSLAKKSAPLFRRTLFDRAGSRGSM